MDSRHTHVRRERAPQFPAAQPPVTPWRAGWREGAAIAAGFLVLLVTDLAHLGGTGGGCVGDRRGRVSTAPNPSTSEKGLLS